MRTAYLLFAKGTPFLFRLDAARAKHASVSVPAKQAGAGADGGAVGRRTAGQ